MPAADTMDYGLPPANLNNVDELEEDNEKVLPAQCLLSSSSR